MRISDWSSDVCSSDLLRGRRQLRGGIGADPGAEREAHQDQWALRQALAQPVGEKYRVLGLATALIMQAFAATDAAEVEAQRVQPGFLRTGRQGIDDLVAERTTHQRMRMAEDRKSTRLNSSH